MNYPKRLTVKVSRNDIRNGTPCLANKCALALAIKKKYRRCDVWVDWDWAPNGRNVIKIIYEDECAEYLLTKRALKFIQDYDNEKIKTGSYSFTLTKFERPRN